MLKKRYRAKTGRKEWALVSVSKPGKVLKWFGIKKPSEEAVAHEEARVEYYKHHG